MERQRLIPPPPSLPPCVADFSVVKLSRNQQSGLKAVLLRRVLTDCAGEEMPALTTAPLKTLPVTRHKATSRQIWHVATRVNRAKICWRGEKRGEGCSLFFLSSFNLVWILNYPHWTTRVSEISVWIYIYICVCVRCLLPLSNMPRSRSLAFR